jgi:hypothetical protein
MKNTRFIVLSVILLMFGIGVGAVTAQQTSDSLAAANNVYVSNVTFDPGTFFTGDTPGPSWSMSLIVTPIPVWL